MAARPWLRAGLLLPLVGGCRAYYVRLHTVASRSAVSTRFTTVGRHQQHHAGARPHITLAVLSVHRIALHLQRVAQRPSRQMLHSSASSGSSPSHAGENNSLADDEADSAAPYHPARLWWTKSRAEKDATVNLVANAGFIAAVAFFALATLVTVDMEVSRGWTASELILRVPIDNWIAYTEVLRANPVLVKACTSGIVYMLGDWTAQTFEGVALADIKRDRVVRSALAGLLLHGPLSHVWYGVCESLFDAIGWNGNWWVTLPKIVTDQLIWGPTWNAVYISFLGVLKRDSFETIWEAARTTAIPLILAGARLWPLAHVITYGLIPTENRLLWVDFVEIVWVTILSRQAADQARSAGDVAELATGGASEGNDPGEADTIGLGGGIHVVEGVEGAETGPAAVGGATHNRAMPEEDVIAVGSLGREADLDSGAVVQEL